MANLLCLVWTEGHGSAAVSVRDTARLVAVRCCSACVGTRRERDDAMQTTHSRRQRGGSEAITLLPRITTSALSFSSRIKLQLLSWQIRGFVLLYITGNERHAAEHGVDGSAM